MEITHIFEVRLHEASQNLMTLTFTVWSITSWWCIQLQFQNNWRHSTTIVLLYELWSWFSIETTLLLHILMHWLQLCKAPCLIIGSAHDFDTHFNFEKACLRKVSFSSVLHLYMYFSYHSEKSSMPCVRVSTKIVFCKATNFFIYFCVLNWCWIITYIYWKNMIEIVMWVSSPSYLCGVMHYGDIIMGTMASQITSLTIVYSTVYSGADQRKHQSSVSLDFVRGIQRGPVNSPHIWPVTRKMFPFDDVIMVLQQLSWWNLLTRLHCDQLCIKLT